jgi:hypothetical protein
VIVHPASTALRLFDAGDTDQPDVATILDWASEYLARPHPELGRAGPVCPYVRRSLNRRRFYVNIVQGTPTTAAELAFAIRPFRDWFLDLAPRRHPDAAVTTILNAFPGLTDRSLVDEAQRALQATFVKDGLMVGEFHDGPPDKPGLRNPRWRPLHSPVPLLAIRHMVPTDLPFLADSPELAGIYHRFFGGATC